MNLNDQVVPNGGGFSVKNIKTRNAAREERDAFETVVEQRL